MSLPGMADGDFTLTLKAEWELCQAGTVTTVSRMA